MAVYYQEMKSEFVLPEEDGIYYTEYGMIAFEVDKGWHKVPNTLREMGYPDPVIETWFKKVEVEMCSEEEVLNLCAIAFGMADKGEPFSNLHNYLLRYFNAL